MARREGRGAASRAQRACTANFEARTGSRQGVEGRSAGRATSVGGCCTLAVCTRQGVEGSKEGSVGGRLRAGGLRGWRRAAAAATTTPFEAPRSRGRRRRARDRARRRERLGVTTISR